MSQDDKSIIEGGSLISEDVPIKKVLGFQWCTVKFGYQGRRFRNGAFDRDLPPGLHRWWSLFGEYRVALVDSRVHLIGASAIDPNDRIEAYGTIQGPLGEDRMPTPPCRVIVPLRLSIQLADIEKHLATAMPFSTLKAMIVDHATLGIGQLRYDQLNSWVSQLKDNLERYLQLNTIRLTGLEVVEVFVGEPKAASEEDKRRLKVFQLATDIKLQSQQLAAQLEASKLTAGARKHEADTLGISPLLQELLKLPGGVEIIKGDQELRKVAIAAGILSGSGATIIPITPGAPYEVGGSYVSPAGNTGPFASIRALPGTEEQTYTPEWPPTQTSWNGSGPISMAGNTPTPPPAASEDAPLDLARIEAERRRFPAKGYAINGAQGTVKDAAGNIVSGYQFTVSSLEGDPSARLSIFFDLLPGFPAVAPLVRVKWGRAKSVPYFGDTVRDWSDDSWLNDILAEIVASPRPSQSVG